MARGINRAIIIGNIGRDPEIRHTAGGVAVVNLSVATTESWRDKQTGEKKESTEWHNITMFGKLAEITGEYLKKSRQVYLEGRLQTRKWQDKDGQDRYTTEIVASDMQMLGGGEGRSGPSGGEDYRKASGGTVWGADRAPASATEAADFEDDVPW